MNGVWDYKKALRAIWERSGYDRGFISNPFWGDEAAKLGLRRTEALLERLGSPQTKYGIVHVAGSKGKGSTVSFIDAVLRAAGYRVGRYTSPHLHAFRERIAVDGAPVSEDAFAALTERAFQESLELERDRPELGEVTAFELTTAMALDGFAAAGCELAVVEVGLGGTLDATNVVTPLVSAITKLDYEHTAVLGSTIEEIAANKAGIIKPGRPVAVSPQVPAALAVIEAAAKENGSTVLLGGRDWQVSGDWGLFAAKGPWGTFSDLTLGLAGPHQLENAATALGAIWLLDQHGVTIPERAVRVGLAGVSWPGRFERVDEPNGTTVVLDGAHTPASAAALAETLAAEEPGKRAVVVLAMLGDKDAAAFAQALAERAERFVVTKAKTPRAMAIDTLSDGARLAGRPIEQANSVQDAVARAIERAGTGGLVVVTGSLATVAEGREALGLAVADPPVEGAR